MSPFYCLVGQTNELPRKRPSAPCLEDSQLESVIRSKMADLNIVELTVDRGKSSKEIFFIEMYPNSIP